MKGLEISILKEDEKLYDIDGEECDKYEENFRKEFEQTNVGKALLESGYEMDGRDFDDCTIQLFYRKKGDK